jgi:adenylosuccinate synthase
LDHLPIAGQATIVVGLQWGDEGKGKIVDRLSGDHDLVVRYNGGANAGHSVVVGDERFALHLVPSGIINGAGRPAVIANGVVVDPDVLIDEIDGLAARGVDVSGLVVSDRAHVVMAYHKLEDALRERFFAAETGSGEGSIGTTLRGIGPCYADKAQRATAIRVGDLLQRETLGARIPAICRDVLIRIIGKA